MDLIDRQAAIDALNKMKIYRPLDSDRYVISDCLNKIVNLPSAQPERQVELVGTESNIEILSELRAQFNCFDEVEEPCYRALSDAICALSEQPNSNETSFTHKALDTISRQAAIDQLYQSYNLLDAERRLEDMPPAQPEQHWISCNDCERRCEKWENSKTLQE